MQGTLRALCLYSVDLCMSGFEVMLQESVQIHELEMLSLI